MCVSTSSKCGSFLQWSRQVNRGREGRAGPVLGVPQPPGPAPDTSQVHRLNVLSFKTIISGVQSTSRVWLLQHKLILIKIK